MNDYIIRAIAANDQIRAFAAVTTETVETTKKTIIEEDSAIESADEK